MGTGKIFTGLAALLFVVTLCSVSFAQENRVLMTTDQQYQNLVKNADFESWVNWTTNNTNPPDAWAKVAAPTILQETSTAKIGATSLKITAVTTGDGISQDVAVEKNTTYTVTFYYKVDSTFSCTFSLAGNVTTFSLTGASGLNSTTWTRKEFTITTANDTTLTVKMVADNASNVFYLDGVSVTKGAATPAFSRAVLNDSGSQTLYGNLTVNGTTNLSGDVNLGSLSTHNITLTGTLKSPAATAVSVQSANGILELKTASKNNELRVWDSTGAKYTSLLNQDLTTYSGDLTINPASGITNITGALTVSTTVTATGNLSAAMLSSDGTNFYDFGNNTGNVPVSNGTLNTNLNAEKLGGLTQSTSGSNAHVLATDASGNISVVNDNASGTVTAATAFITGTNPALTGQIRIPNNTWINARNAANGADINLISLDTSNRVNFGTTPVAAFTAAGTITGSSSPIITGFGTINGATLSGGTLSGGSLSGGAYTGVDLTPTTLTLGNGIVYTLNPAINVSSPGATGYTALKVAVTETSVGSGTKNLLDLSVGASQKFVVNSTGQLTTGDIPGARISSDISYNSANVTGTVAVGHGGTGVTSFTSNGILYGNGSGNISVTAAGTNNYILYSNSGTPAWTNAPTISGANITNLNGSNISSGTVAVGVGGTGITSYTIGDLIYASAGTTLSKLADVATGSVLVSGGAGAAPSYSSSPTISGTLTVQGLGASSFGGNVGIGSTSPGAPLDVVKAYTTSSGLDYGAIVEPTYNVTSGSNKYTALLVKSTETHIEGYTGAKLLLDLQAGSSPTSKFSVDNAGNITQVASATINGQTIASTSTFNTINVDNMTVGGGYGNSGITMDTNGNLKLDGDIFVKGVMYRDNLTDLQVQNSTITLNASEPATDRDSYIGVMSGGTKAAPTYTGQIKWDSSSNKRWEFSNPINLVSGKTYKIAGTDVLSATDLGANVINSSLTKVGTISTGVWQGTPVGVAFGGTNIASYAAGDMIYASGATALSKVTIGAANKVLTSSGSAPQWVDTLNLGGTLTVSGVGASSFAGNVGIGTTAPSTLLDVYNKPANNTGLAVAAVIKPDYSLLNTASDGYTALKVNVTDAQAGATGAKNLLDLQIGGTSKAKIDSTGGMTIQALTIGSTPLTSSTAGSEGAKLVGTNTSYTHFTSGGTVQGALASIDSALGAISGGSGSFTNLTVIGTSDLQGTISNSTAANGGAVTVADLFLQTGSGNQVTFQGNVDAQNGLDVTGASLTAANSASITGGLNNNNGGITNAGAISGATSITASGNISTTAGTITAANGLTVTAGGATVTAGGLTVSAGGAAVTGNSTVTGSLGVAGANNFTVNTSKFTVDGTSGNTVVAGTLRSLATVCMAPEYNNATPRPDGSDNFGTLSLQYDNAHNYYEWTTGEPTTQDYDIVIRYRLPDGFTGFDATAPIQLYNRVSSTPGATKVNVTMLDTAGVAVTLSGGSNLQNTSWQAQPSTITISGTPTFTAGGYITITIKLSADQAKVADIGELTLKGNW